MSKGFRRRLVVRLCVVVSAILFAVGGDAQTFNVNREIPALSEPIRNASVTYIDQFDTARQ